MWNSQNAEMSIEKDQRSEINSTQQPPRLDATDALTQCLILGKIVQYDVAKIKLTELAV